MNIGSIHHKGEEGGETYFTGGILFLLYANTWTHGAFSEEKNEKIFLSPALFYACKRQCHAMETLLFMYL
jgi:hypothetical protein